MPEAEERNSQSSLLSNSAVMATGTVLSRITGIARDIALTAALGLTIVRDTFALGNSLPNIVYILMVGGMLNAVFVPQLVRKMKQDADGGKAYADALLTATATVLFVLSVIAVIAAPVIVAIYATSGYDPQQQALAVTFARYCLPQIFFYGLATMIQQVMNARGGFGPPMFAPIANNIVVIVVYISFIAVAGTSAADNGTLSAGQAAWLGIGTTVGVAVQALVLMPLIGRYGYHYSMSWQWRGLGLGKAAKLAGWTIGLVLVNQLALVVIVRLATQANVNATEAGLPPAGLATYQTGYLIFQLPHGVITVSVVTALLPGLSRLVDAGKLRRAGGELAAALRTIMLLVAPVSVVLFFTGDSLALLLFGYGAAGTDQVLQLGIVTSIFALGIIPFSAYYVLLRGWYAFEDTRTPFLLALVLQVIHVGFAVVLFNAAAPGASQVNGLTLAYVLAHWIMVLVAWPILRRRYGHLQTKQTLWTGARIAIAALLGWAGGFVASVLFNEAFESSADKTQALAYIVVVVVSVLIPFVLFSWLFRIAELRTITALIGTKLRRG